MVAVMEKKLVFGRDQVVTSTQASKNFGDMRRRARKEPQFVDDRNDGIDTVIVSFDDFEAMAVELQQLREERLYATAAARLFADADDAVPVEDIIGANEFAKIVEAEASDGISDAELFE